jgi:PAS domain S-box-containing protein
MFAMPDQLLNILLVEDDEDDYIILRDTLSDMERKHVRLRWVPSYEKAMENLSAEDWDTVLVDYDLGAHNGLELIREAVAQGCKYPFIMVTGHGSYELDLQAMEAGAAEYISKNQLNTPFLERVIRYAIEHKQVEKFLENAVQERTRDLQNALEELQVTEEELRVQNEELAHARKNEDPEYILNKLEAELGQFREWFISAKIGLLITDHLGKIIEINQAALDDLGMEKTKVVGRLLQMFITPSERQSLRKELYLLSKSTSPQSCVLSFQRGDQKPARRNVIAAPIAQTAIYWILQP